MVEFCDGVSEWTGITVSWLVWIVMGLCVFEVVTRRIFNSPHIWSYDVINGFYSVHFMLLGGYTLLKGGHVSIDIFSIRLSSKTQSLLQIITYLIFFFPFFIVFFYVGCKSAFSSWSYFERTAVGLPLIMPIMKTTVPLASLLLLIQGIPELARHIAGFRKGSLI
jgi:TRAP-type mannitol/chloroaromatic compound transport system permease small subunit